MAIPEIPDNLASFEELVNKIDELNIMMQSIVKSFIRYEPLLVEAERRLSAPFNFGRRKA